MFKDLELDFNFKDAAIVSLKYVAYGAACATTTTFYTISYLSSCIYERTLPLSVFLQKAIDGKKSGVTDDNVTRHQEEESNGDVEVPQPGIVQSSELEHQADSEQAA